MYTNCDLILSVKDAEDHDKWLKVRNQGLGGSDAAVIMGFSNYKSPYQLWMEKIGEAEPEDLSGNMPVYWGNKHEANIAQWFTEATGKKVQRSGTLRNRTNPFMIANVDCSVVGENAGLEIKTAGYFKGKLWEEDEIPDAYYCQCLHYMAVTGADYWYIAVLIGGNKPDWKKISRNEADIAELIEAERKFWGLVQTKTPPPVDGSESCTQALCQHYKMEKGEQMDLPDETVELIEGILLDKATIKALEKNCDLKKNKLAEIMKNAEIGVIGDHKVTYRSGDRTSIKAAEVKKHPELYKQLEDIGAVSVTSSRSVRVWK